jgi:hypothetical protein
MSGVGELTNDTNHEAAGALTALRTASYVHWYVDKKRVGSGPFQHYLGVCFLIYQTRILLSAYVTQRSVAG